MAQLTTTRTYNDGEVLVKSELDAPFDDIENFINVTKINDDNIQNSGITGSTKLLNASVTAGKLAANSVTSSKIADDAVTTDKIIDDAVTNAKIADTAVDTAQLAANAVTTAKITDANITTAKIANNAVDSTKLASDPSVDANRAVTTDHIKDSQITAAKILNGTITPAKLSTNWQAVSLSPSRTSAGTTDTDIGVAITTSGRPVEITVYSGSFAVAGISGGGGTLSIVRWDGASTTVIQKILDVGFGNTFNYGTSTVSATGASTQLMNVAGATTIIDTPASGTYTYRLRLVQGGTNNCTGTSIKILVREI